LRGLRDTLATMRFNWKRLIRKEYGSTFAWISTAFLLLGWQAVANFGWEAARSEAMTLFVFWLPLLAAYFTARVLKKTGRLGKEGRGG
jgi:heme O synthase-like polyprenyltransferase